MDKNSDEAKHINGGACGNGHCDDGDVDKSNKLDQDQLQQQQQLAKNNFKEDTSTKTTIESNNNNNNNKKATDDSSSFGTAFTISFDDDDSGNNGNKKKFSIRDSIRKFAPPKPQTIENPNRIVLASSRNNNNNNRDQAAEHLMSIESAPPALNNNNSNNSSNTGGNKSNSKQRTPTRNKRLNTSASSNHSQNHNHHHNGSSRNRTSTPSDHSSQSIVSESAAYLIDKMLAGQTASTVDLDNNVTAATRKGQSPRNIRSSPSKKQQQKQYRHRQDINDCDGRLSVDYCDDRSDNGTYVVGSDPDVEAARKSIDEVFGLMEDGHRHKNGRSNNEVGGGASRWERRAESAKILSSTPQQPKQHHNSRSGKRTCEKSQNILTRRSSGLSKERQQHIDRLAYRDINYRNPSVSRSSSSSRTNLQETIINNKSHHKQQQQQQHHSRKPTRNLSCERTSTNKNVISNHHTSSSNRSSNRRSVSQSSRNSTSNKSGRESNTGQSDEDTTSSRSSMSHATRECSDGYDGPQSLDLPQSVSSHPNMKFNRAFALRRARLGLDTQISKLHNSNNTDGGDSNNSTTTATGQLGIKGNSQSYTEQLTKLHQNQIANPTKNSIKLGALDSLVITAISSLSQKICHSVCDVLVDQAKRLPSGNETRLVVEEILPQIMVQENNKVPTTVEEIDRSLYFDLAKTLRNLKKVEQIVDVISMISKQTPGSACSNKSSLHNSPVRANSATNSNNDN